MVTIRNIVEVAIMQVGVIVAGVLGSGLCYKAWTTSGLALPPPAAMLYHNSIAWLLIPLVWGTGTVAFQLRARTSDDVKALVFCFGVLILIGLAVFAIYADVTPWFRVMWGVGADDAGGE